MRTTASPSPTSFLGRRTRTAPPIRGQVDGQGCVYPASVETIASQLDARFPLSPTTHIAAWRAYEQDMGNSPMRDGGTPDPTGGTDCAHPAIGATDTAEVATSADQYATRHNPFVWFHSVIDDTAECVANVVPLGTLQANGTPSPTGHLARDLRSESTTPRFGFVTPNLCSDGHDANVCGPQQRGWPRRWAHRRRRVPPGLDAPRPRVTGLRAW